MATNKENLKTTPIAERFATDESWTTSGSISSKLASVTPEEMDMAGQNSDEPGENELVFVLADGTPAVMPEDARRSFCLGVRYRNMAIAAHKEFIDLAKPISEKIDFLRFKQDLYKIPKLHDKEFAELHQTVKQIEPEVLRLISKRDEYDTKCKIFFDQAWEISYDLIGRVSGIDGCDCIGMRKGWVLVKRNHNHNEMLQQAITGALAGAIADSRTQQGDNSEFDDYADFFKKNDTIL